MRDDNPLQFREPSDVDGYTVGVYGPSNTSFSLLKIESEIKNLSVDMTEKDEFAFNKLSLDRVNAVYSNRDVGFDLIQKLNLKNIRVSANFRCRRYENSLAEFRRQPF